MIKIALIDYEDGLPDLTVWWEEEEPVKFVRTSGNMICEECSKEYWRHPFSNHIGFDDQPFLRILCDGRLVKL